jgi:hypothetical protein
MRQMEDALTRLVGGPTLSSHMLQRIFPLLIAFGVAAAVSIASAMAATEASCGPPDRGEVSAQCVAGSACMPPAIEPAAPKALSTLPSVLTVVVPAHDARPPDTAPPKPSAA